MAVKGAPIERGVDCDCERNTQHGKTDFFLELMYGQIHHLLEEMDNSCEMNGPSSQHDIINSY